MDTACIRFREVVRADEKVGFHVNHLNYGCLQELIDEAELVTRILPRTGNQRQPRQMTGVHLASVSEEVDSVSETVETSDQTAAAPGDWPDWSILLAKVETLNARQIASLEARLCWNCRKTGHISYDCPEPRRKDYQNPKQKKKKKDKKESSSESETVKKDEAKEKVEKPDPKPQEKPPSSGNDK